MSDRSRGGALHRVALLSLTAGGLGLLRPAPGTWGSLPPVFVAAALAASGAGGWAINGALVALLLFGSWACLAHGDRAEAVFGRKDPGSVVADEVAGQAVTLLLLPWPAERGSIALLAVTGFLAFRAFDILKPPPAHGLQRIPGGAGILIDDLVAGLYAAIVTQCVARFLL